MTLLLLLLLAAAALDAASCSSSGTGDAAAGSLTTARVSSPAAFVAALSNDDITEIHLAEDLLMHSAEWPALAIHIRRNLTVMPVASSGGWSSAQRTIEFGLSRERISVERGCDLRFHDLVMGGLCIGNYMTFVAHSPGAHVWMLRGAWRAPICSSLNKLLAIISNLPRPDHMPGRQVMSKLTRPYCVKGMCFHSAFLLSQGVTASRLSHPTNVDLSKIESYTSIKYDVIWACDTTFTDACVAGHGYDSCREEASAMHKRGLRHMYDERWLTGFAVLAAVLCVLLAGGCAKWASKRRFAKQLSTKRRAAVLPPSSPPLQNALSRHSLMQRGSGSPVPMPSAGSTRHSQPLQSGSTADEDGRYSGETNTWVDRNSRGHFVAKGHPDNVEIGAFLGAGSYGRVYNGVWQDKTVAVKIIPHLKQASDKIAAEAALSLSLVHPNVVRTFHHFTIVEGRAGDDLLSPPSSLSKASSSSVPSTPAAMALPQQRADSSGLSQPFKLFKEEQSTWIIQELCDLGTLSTHLKLRKGTADDNRIEHAVMIGFALDIARGMEALHKQNILHGDLKAANTLVMTDANCLSQGVAKVADFGLSREMADRTHLSTHSFGTVTHMPPELLVDGLMSREADVYSYGIMLWEVATCEPLYPDMNPVQVLTHVLTLKARPVFPAHVPEDFVNLARECWALEKLMRPTFAEVVVRLEGMVRRRSLSAAQQPL